MDVGLALIVFIVSLIVGGLLALVAQWQPAAGAVAIAVTLTAATMLRPR